MSEVIIWNWSILYNWDCNWSYACGWPDCFHVVGICYFAEFWTVIFSESFFDCWFLEHLGLNVCKNWNCNRNYIFWGYARTEIVLNVCSVVIYYQIKYYKPFPSRTWKFMQELKFGGGTPSSIYYKPIHAM